MKIKRYMAVSMRAALAQVRVEQGPDAVILSSRRAEDGIEVIAAVDYDEALFTDATLKRAPAMSAETLNIPTLQPEPEGRAVPRAERVVRRVESVVQRTVPVRVERPDSAMAVSTPEKHAPSVVRTSDDGFNEMQRELRGLRNMLQGELAHMSWHDKRQREPLQARVLEELTALDIAPDIALSLANQTPQRTSVENPSNVSLALLVKHLPVVDNQSTVNSGVIALVGPTGAGKTTTIAKLAAHWSMQHGSKDLAFVTTDSYRIGAREQLMTYARILGAPVHVANSGPELARVLERLKSKQLVLIDTAGMGPRDVRLSEQLAALQLGAARAQVLLTLPAQSEAQALEEIVHSFARVSPTACILTKVDEAASLGAVLSTTLRHKLRIAYLCTGQRVPEDLHASHALRLWLIRVASKLKERAPPCPSEAYYARHFGRAPAHA